MTAVRVYLIGAGAIARFHARALPKLPADQVTLAVTDTHPATLGEFARQFPDARVASDVAVLLAEPAEPNDIVVVATPPAAHAPLTLAALASGRHVLCEKPLALDMAQAGEMLRLARRQRRLLGCCSTRFLGLPTTEAVKQLLRAGALGQPYHVTFVNRWQRSRPGVEYQPTSSWFLDRSQSGGGVVMDWGPYDIAVLNDLLAPIRVEVLGAWMVSPATALPFGREVTFDVEEHAGASLRFHRADGSAVDVSYERAACTHVVERAEAEIAGRDGAASWDWLMWKRRGEVRFTRDQECKLVVETTEHVDDGAIGYMDKPLYYFAQRVLGQPSPALIDEQALFNFACVRAIYDSAEIGRPQSVARDGSQTLATE